MLTSAQFAVRCVNRWDGSVIMFWGKYLAFSLLMLCTQSLAQSPESNFGSPNYLLQGSFVLEAKPSERPLGSGVGYEVITYLPHSTLVFTRPNKKYPYLGQIHEIEKKKNILSITQHGQRVLVPEK